MCRKTCGMVELLNGIVHLLHMVESDATGKTEASRFFIQRRDGIFV